MRREKKLLLRTKEPNSRSNGQKAGLNFSNKA